MKINIQHNYYPEDMVPYSVVRDHLRYDYGDAEELVKSYVASACDYMETLTNRVFCFLPPNNTRPLRTRITPLLRSKRYGDSHLTR